MKLVLGILCIAIMVIISIGMVKDTPHSDGVEARSIGGGLSLLTSFILAFYFIFSYFDPSPSALDVYRGNTELKITKIIVNDKITNTDSIVVWKKQQP